MNSPHHGSVRAAEDVLSALRSGRRGLWERLWFGSASLVRLAVFRIIVLSTALFALHFHRTSLVEGHAAQAFTERRFVPLYFLEVLGLGPLDPEFARVLYVVLFGLILLGIAGLFTRTVCALVALGMLYWVGMAYSYGQPHHEYGMLAFALGGLALGPVGARLSLDSLWARWRAAAKYHTRATPPTEAPGALLPIRFAQVSIALGYLFSGLTKLRFGGLEWMNGYTLQGIMLEFDGPLTELIAANLWAVRLLSIGVIVAQTFSFVAVLWRPSRWFYVPVIVSVHLGAMLTMDTGSFFALWILQAAFVDWEKLPGFLARNVRDHGKPLWRFAWLAVTLFAAAVVLYFYCEKGSPIVPWLFLPVGIAGLLGLVQKRADLIYDGGCGLCLKTIACVDALNWSARIRLLDANAWEQVSKEHPSLSQQACLEDIHCCTNAGHCRRGFDAYRTMAWRLPPTVLVAPLLYVPGVPLLGKRIYRRVAKHRLTSSCVVPPR